MCCEMLTAAYPSVCSQLICLIPALDCPAPNPKTQRVGRPLHLNQVPPIRKFKAQPTPPSILF